MFYKKVIFFCSFVFLVGYLCLNHEIDADVHLFKVLKCRTQFQVVLLLHQTHDNNSSKTSDKDFQ